MKIGVCSGLVIGVGLALFVALAARAQNKAHTGPNANSAKKPELRKVGTVPGDISPDTAEVIWLFHHGSTKGELLHYINLSHVNFKLSVEDVNYLKDIGVPTDVVFAMIRPPESRENVVRLKDRYPKWYSARLRAPNSGHPQHALENHELIQTEHVETDTPAAEGEPEVHHDPSFPHYSGPITDPDYGFTTEPQRGTYFAPVPSNYDDRKVSPRDQR